jgi:glycosyltransferase involved in cell wall biosynthesis
VKIAWFTPFSVQSAIGAFSELVVRELVKHADVTVFASDIRQAAEARSAEFDLRVLADLSVDRAAEQLAAFDIPIYNLGNHYEMHHRTLEVAQRRSGLVILHDLVMHHLFMARYLIASQDPAGYMAELEYAHGTPGRLLAERILAGKAGDVFDGPAMLEFHMARSAVRNSLGVVVHSEFARSALDSVASSPVLRLPFPGLPHAPTARTPAQRVDGRLRLLTIGMVNRNKMIEEVIRVIGSSPLLRERVVYQVVGPYERNVSYHARLRSAIEEQALESKVELLGYQNDDALQEYLASADIVINLRNPHFGEGSWSLLETAFAGKPTVVWKHGFYDEFPADAVAKISSLDELRTTLERLADSDTERQSLGRRALAYAQATFATDQYCQRLRTFAEACKYNAPVLALADFASQRLAEFFGSASVDVPALDRIAVEISAVSGIDASTATETAFVEPAWVGPGLRAPGAAPAGS